MNLFYAAVAFLLALVLVLVGVSRVGAWRIERAYPPSGDFARINGTRIHYVHVPAANPDLPPVVFIHGASGNLRDQMVPLRPLLENRAQMLFLDRPGHGWSERGSALNENPTAQAATIAALMTELGIRRAIVVGHSFGGAVAAAFAVAHPDRTTGLVFLAAATHPWPGGGTSWYYHLTAVPVLGRLFTETLAYPGGLLRMPRATACVFAPNALPEGYSQNTAIPLVLRPHAFRANATDVEGLYRHVVAVAPRYREIAVPTVVVTGDRDSVVYEEIHSTGLHRDIAGSELVWVKNLGHKPDWIAPDLVVASIERVAGMPRDLQALARQVESRIADDTFGAGICSEAVAPTTELAPQ